MSGAGGSVGGYQSSSEESLVQQAIKNMYSTLASTQGQYGYQTGEQNIANQISGLGQVSSVSGAPLSTLSAAESGGVSAQNALQSYLTNQTQPYSQQITDTQSLVNALTNFLKVSGTTPANQFVSTSGQTGALSGLFSGLASGGSGSSIGSSLYQLLTGSGGGSVGNYPSNITGGAGAGNPTAGA
jgi:hypothetical protein